MTPLFLTLEEVIALQQSQVNAWGGIHGIRDAGTLESAVSAPQNHFMYGHGDIFDLAASLMFALITNHAFLDGNKGVGTLAAAVFLEMNGVELGENRSWLNALEAVSWKAARAEATREEIAAVLRKGVCGA